MKFMNALGAAALMVGASSITFAEASLGKAIDVSGRQRMLSQKMVKEILYVYNDINASENIGNLEKTSNLYNTSLDQLILGDDAAGIPSAASDADTFAELTEVQSLWEDVKGLIDGVVAEGSVDKGFLSFLDENSITLLKESNDVVQSLVKALNSGAGTDPATANTINIAGRQRMLSQKMSKEFLFIKAGFRTDKYKSELSKTVDLFENSLKDLKSGNAGKNIASPSDKVAAQLDVVSGIWAEISPALRKAASGGAITAADVSTVSSKEGPLLVEMNKAVKMY